MTTDQSKNKAPYN